MNNQNKPRRQFLKDSVKASGLMIMSPLIPKISLATTAEKQQEIIAKMSNNFLEEIKIEKNKACFYR